MAAFSTGSRYARFAVGYETVDRRGRTVRAVSPAERPIPKLLGEHLKRDGERLDHLADFYLKDPTAFWRIADLNEVLIPDALAQAPTLEIPVKR